MDRYFYFYDLNEVLIDRYPAKISKYLQEVYHTSNFIFIYSEKYKNSEPKNLPEGSKSFYIPDLSLKKINKLISKYPPKSLTTIAQRIPDMLMLSIFNRRNIPTFIVQHGLWSDKLDRIPLILLLFSKLLKFINYVYHVYTICRINNLVIYKTLYELYRFLLKEDIRIPETTQLNNDMLRAKKAFVFDTSWNGYYLKQYGYSTENLIYIGNPDYLLLKDLNLNDKEDAVCYICQSLVEDGRFLKTEYQKFLTILKERVADKKKLYIKLHPRSRIELYEIFQNNRNVVFTNDLPACKYYIGHYSGLLATVAQISDNILIWNLPNHHIPHYFVQFGSMISDKVEDITKFISGQYNRRNIYINKLTTEEIKSFNPIAQISETLINLNL